MSSNFRFVSIALVSLIFACGKKVPSEQVASSAAVATDGGADAGEVDDDVEPVYPVDPKAAAVPLAEVLCKGLHEMPEQKRSACCSAPLGITVTSECVRTVSAAIRSNAIELSETAVQACVASFEQSLDGCDWVGPFPPQPPAACAGIFVGKVEEGRACRSSLECSGELRCLGVGPTTKGKCGPAKALGELCGGTVDTLATYTRQNDLEKQHPECRGSCSNHRCAPLGEVDAPCQTSANCAAGLQCLPVTRLQKKCSAKPLPKESRRTAGEECSSDFECLGGCLKPQGKSKGRCGPRCDLR